MGTSTRYSSAADDHPLALKSEKADASGPSPVSAIPNNNIRDALDRVNQSLKLVLAHIATLQREMGLAKNQDINTSLNPDVPLKPDNTWNGTP